MPSPGTSDPEDALSYRTDEDVRRGHEVTLFASTDSCTGARLKSLCATPFCQVPENWSQAGATIMTAEQAFRTCADEFDSIHSHCGIEGFPMARRCPAPTLTTLHDLFDLPEYVSRFKRFRDLPLVSPSDAQRQPVAWASSQQTIYPGMPSELYRFNPRPGKHLAVFGSLCLEEGLGPAVELARRAHFPLRVASRQGGIGRFSLSRPMELLIADHGIEWLGEFCEEEEHVFAGEALALVCAHDWPGSSGRQGHPGRTHTLARWRSRSAL